MTKKSPITLTVSLLFLLISSFFFYPTNTALAHPGNTDSYGCHTCRTNCSNWGLSTGEYHCHNSKGSYQPESPIKSTWGSGGTGSTEPWPSYSDYTNLFSTPSCPANSYYDGISSCKCSYGYVVKGNQCVSGSSVCTEQIGFMSTYNSLSNRCECMSGYEIGSSGMCTFKTSTYSPTVFGYEPYDFSQGACPKNSHTSLLDSNMCTCDTGYQVSKNKKSCEKTSSTSLNKTCRDSFGKNSKWDGTHHSNGDISCVCKTGYKWNSGQTKCLKS